MSRWVDWAARMAVLLPTVMLHTVQAQEYPPVVQAYGAQQAPYRMAAQTNIPTPIEEAAPVGPAGTVVTGPIQQPGYVHLGAPLYPSPKPDIPYWTGGTMITNQALAPHEMLYPHTYRGLHGPYFHRVVGGWIVTPFGVRSHERWELQGTQVEVKYRSKHPIWPAFHTPAVSRNRGFYQ